MSLRRFRPDLSRKTIFWSLVHFRLHHLNTKGWQCNLPMNFFSKVHRKCELPLNYSPYSSVSHLWSFLWNEVFYENCTSGLSYLNHMVPKISIWHSPSDLPLHQGNGIKIALNAHLNHLAVTSLTFYSYVFKALLNHSTRNDHVAISNSLYSLMFYLFLSKYIHVH